MSNIRYCDDDCEYLSITEEEQNNMEVKPFHICLFYSERLYHGDSHPCLYRTKECYTKIERK